MLVAKEAIEAGVDILQMREKGKSSEDLLELGEELSLLCKKNKVPFIVNDNPFLAAEVDADGVHLGQEDIKEYPIGTVRAILGENRIIGISTHSVSQFKEANELDVDYLAFGPVFQTKTKDYYIGTDDVEEVLNLAKKPVVFIGGIDLENVDMLVSKGAKNIAVIRAITEAEDITRRVKEFKGKLGK